MLLVDLTIYADWKLDVTGIKVLTEERIHLEQLGSVEKVHIDFCKQLLSVKKATQNASVYCELGRFPLKYHRLYRILKYWVKLLNTDNRILKSAYANLLDLNISQPASKDNWAGFVKNNLQRLGFDDIWASQNVVNVKHFLARIKQRIFDQAKQDLLQNVKN